MSNTKSFASDNFAGVHPEIMQALVSANQGHTKAYGDDEYTARAVTAFKKLLGDDIAVYFVYGGTPANVLGLQAITQSYQGILCAETAHINVDECGAPEKYTGSKLIDIPTPNGKLTVDLLSQKVHGIGDQHHVQPGVISITQATETGLVYTPQEIQDIAHYAHTHNMLLHVDGARIANAAAFLNGSLRAITADVGVDVLSFGGTKNGMMYGEAVVFFNPTLGKQFKFIRKQGMQLASKMRYIGAQFEALLSNDLWLQNAQHANRMAQLLAQKVKNIPGVRLTQEVQGNAVFAIIPQTAIAHLQKASFFYVWNEATSEVRWMTSFDTQEKDIDSFVELIHTILQ